MTIEIGRREDLSAVELFCGGGGMLLGVKDAGFKSIAAVERDDRACETLQLNGVSGVIHADVRDVDFQVLRDQVDLLTGGPPCQPFSNGGYHLGDQDDRDMIPQFIRAIKEMRPRVFVMENVNALLHDRYSQYMARILSAMGSPEPGLRYGVASSVLCAADYGIPQVRRRLFVVGVRSDVGPSWSPPPQTHSELALVRDQWVSGAYWDQVRVSPSIKMKPPNSSTLGRARDCSLLPWVTVRQALDGCPASTDAQVVTRVAARGYLGHTGNALDLPAKVIKAGVHGVPGGENMLTLDDGTSRYLTVREAARIQSFPDAWKFSGTWSQAMRQIGNAVPCGLVTAIASQLRNEVLS